MSGERVQYNPQYLSVIHDRRENQPVFVALKEDIYAYVEQNSDPNVKSHVPAFAVSTAVNGLHRDLQYWDRQHADRLHSRHVSVGHVLETRRDFVRHPQHALGVRLETLGVLIELIDQQQQGDIALFERFGPKTADLFRRFAGAVLL